MIVYVYNPSAEIAGLCHQACCNIAHRLVPGGYTDLYPEGRYDCYLHFLVEELRAYRVQLSSLRSQVTKKRKKEKPGGGGAHL